MYMFIKMSSKWFYREVQSISQAMNCYHAMEHVSQGEIIAFGDDVEYFADEMGIKVEDMEKAE